MRRGSSVNPTFVSVLRVMDVAKNKSQDTLVYRLSSILIKLNHGEKLDPQGLADEYGVNLRTIQRDLNERFAYLPLQRKGKTYYLDPIYLGKLTIKDIERFASLAGVKGLFPSLSSDFLAELFDARMQSAITVKGHHYEDLSGKERQFAELEEAIVQRCHISFDYKKTEERKHYSDISPLRLINNKGIWYLAAMHDGKFKTFSFSRISIIQKQASHFEPIKDIDALLSKEEGVWISQDAQEVVLNISPEVAGYFKRRKLIANQVIEKELETGGLIISTRVGHVNQVLSIVKYWIPYIRIISPDGLQEQVNQSLRAYLEK